MAKVLLLDDQEVAGRALQDILARGNHTCVVARDIPQAWQRLRASVEFDLAVVEIRLGPGSGLEFVERLRDDWLLRTLPVVIYTAENDPRQVRRALASNVQNYLLKPYDEPTLQAEIVRAVGRCWRTAQFEETPGWCERTGLSPEELTLRRQTTRAAFAAAARTFPRWAENREPHEVLAALAALIESAEAAGIRAGIDALRQLRERAEQERWSAFEGSGDQLAYVEKLIAWRVDPAGVEETGPTVAPKLTAADEAERLRWERIDPAAKLPLLRPEALRREVTALAGCPVTRGAAAAFQMMTEGRFATMTRLMDLVAGDPGLAAHLLGVANRERREDVDEIDDPHLAVARLGEARLAALARALPVADERLFELPPLHWPGYWIFQATVGRVAQFICKYLELDDLAASAATAGLLHDLGRLLLLKLHPYALRGIVLRAREKGRPVGDVERDLLGCSTRDLALAFAEAQKLPASCRSVIRWVEAPALATSHLDLVAIVAVARHLVCHAHIGVWPEAPAGGQAPLVTTPAWRLLRSRLFPSFDARKFEVQAHAYCLTVRNELSGRIASGRPSHAERAAELV